MTHRLTAKAWLLSTCSLMLAATAGAALAQPAAPSSPAGSGVEEVVVTARKQSESIVQAPVAVSALSATDLTNRGITGYQGMSDFVPGFKYQNQSVNRNDRGFTHFTIRGMQPGNPSPDRQAASAFIDGVPIGNGSIAGLADVAQVEVVKGPQSAYFGRSTFAGAINFITRNPSFEPKATVEATYSSFNNTELKGSVEGGLIKDVLSARLGGRYYHTDGQYKNAATGGNLGEQETYAGSLSVFFAPTSTFRAKAFVVAWRDRDGAPASGQLAPADLNCTTVTGRRYYCGEIDKTLRNRLIQQTYVGQTAINYTQGAIGPGASVNEPGFQDQFGVKRNAYQANASFDWDLPAQFTLSGNGSLSEDRWGYVTDTGFQDGRGTANPFFGRVADVLPYNSRTVGGQVHFTTRSAEVRLSSPQDRRLKGLIGASYYKQRNTQVTNAFQNSGYAASVLPTLTETTTKGVFGSVTFNFTDALSLSAEGRYQIDALEVDTLVPGGLQLSDDTKSFAPRVIARYEFSKDRSIYLSYAKGTRPSQFNGFLYSLAPSAQAQVLAQSNVSLFVPEEKVEMTEIGFKSYFLDRKIRVLAAAYTGKWTDKHISQTVGYFNPTFQTITVTIPGGEVDLRGVELEGVYRPDDHFTFEGNFAYSQSEIVKTACSECTQLINNANPVGNRLPLYPAYTGALSGTYERPAFADFNGFVRLDYIYTGRIYESEANLAWIAPTHKANLRVGVSNARYRIEAFGENIFDNKTPLSIASNLDSFTSARTLTFSPALRRTVGVHVAATF